MDRSMEELQLESTRMLIVMRLPFEMYILLFEALPI